MTVTAFAVVDTNGLNNSDAIETGTEGVLWGMQPEAWIQHEGQQVLLFSCNAQSLWVPNLYDSEGREMSVTDDCVDMYSGIEAFSKLLELSGVLVAVSVEAHCGSYYRRIVERFIFTRSNIKISRKSTPPRFIGPRCIFTMFTAILSNSKFTPSIIKMHSHHH